MKCIKYIVSIIQKSIIEIVSFEKRLSCFE